MDRLRDPNAGRYLAPRIGIVIQWEIAASNLGTESRGLNVALVLLFKLLMYGSPL